MKSVEDFLAAYNLSINNQECMEEDASVSTVGKSFQQARMLAVRYIGVSRRKTSGRVRSHLLEKEFSPELVEHVIAELENDGYIDDMRIAAGVVRYRKGGRAEGRKALRYRMQGLGLKDEAIDAAINSDPDEEDQRCYEFLEHKCTSVLTELAGTFDSRDAYLLKAKLLRRCTARGFTNDIALRQIERLVRQIRESDYSD